jgi:hypothetical protein
MKKLFCKLNYAVIVNKIMPVILKIFQKISFKIFTKIQYLVRLILKNIFNLQQISGIIKITQFCFGGNNYAERFQKQFFKRTGYFKPKSAESFRLSFSALRLLRPEGSYSGQIRNDSECGKGWHRYYPSYKKLWCFKTILLQSPRRIPTKGYCWFNSQKKGAKGSTQTDHGNNEFCRQYFNSKQENQFYWSVKSNKRAVWFYCSFTKYRKGSGKTQKKTVSQRLVFSLAKESFIESYEKLRTEILDKQAGNNSGLALFMRKGFLHWMEVCSKCFDSAACKRKVAINTGSIGHNRELTGLLAMMALFAGKEAVKNG